MSKITFEDVFNELNSAGALVGNIIAGMGNNGVTMFLSAKNLNPTPTTDIQMKVECLGVISTYEYNQSGGLFQYALNPADDTINAPYIAAMYQIGPYGESDKQVAGTPNAPQGNYSPEIKFWFESKTGAYETSDKLILKLNVTAGADASTGTVTFVSSEIEQPLPQLTTPSISVENNTVTITQAENAQIWYTTNGTTPVPGAGTQLINIVKGLSYIGVPSGVYPEGIIGSAENLLTSLDVDDSATQIIAGGTIVGAPPTEMQQTVADLDNVPDGTYKTGFAMSGACINLSKLDLTHSYYISFSCENSSSFYPSLIQYSRGVSKFYRKTGNKYSLIDSLSNFIIGVEGSIGVFYATYLVLISADESPAPTLSTLKATNLIFVDVTANQKYFKALGYTTQKEIQNYLDTIPYSDFTIWTEDAPSPGVGSVYSSPFSFTETIQVKAVATDTTGQHTDSEIAFQEAVPEITEATTGPFVIKKISQLPFAELTNDTRVLVQENGEFKQVRGSEFQKVEGSLPSTPEETDEIDPELMAHIKYGPFINCPAFPRTVTENEVEHFLCGVSSPLIDVKSNYTICLAYGADISTSSSSHKESWIYKIFRDTSNPLLRNTSIVVNNVITINGTTENLNTSPSAVSDVFRNGGYIYAVFQTKDTYNYNLVRRSTTSANTDWSSVVENVQFACPLDYSKFFVMKKTIADSGVRNPNDDTLIPISSLVSGLPFSSTDELLGTYCISDKGIAIDLQCTDTNSSAILFTSNEGDSWELLSVSTNSIPYTVPVNYSGGWWYRLKVNANGSADQQMEYYKSKDLKEWILVYKNTPSGNPPFDQGIGVETENLYLGNKGYTAVPFYSPKDQINFPPLTQYSTTLNAENILYYYEGCMYTIGYYIESSTFSLSSSGDMKIFPCIAYKRIM